MNIAFTSLKLVNGRYAQSSNTEYLAVTKVTAQHNVYVLHYSSWDLGGFWEQLCRRKPVKSVTNCSLDIPGPCRASDPAMCALIHKTNT